MTSHTQQQQQQQQKEVKEYKEALRRRPPHPHPPADSTPNGHRGGSRVQIMYSTIGECSYSGCINLCTRGTPTVPNHHMSSCHHAGHQQPSPHAPHLLPTHGERRLFTTAAHQQHPPPSTLYSVERSVVQLPAHHQHPTHPSLQHGSQCRPATCPPPTPHATLTQQISRPQLLCMEHRTFNYLLPPTPHASEQYLHAQQSFNSPFCFAGVKPQPFAPAPSSTNRLI